MNIKIGDNNKIKGSHIGHEFGDPNHNKKSFVEKHPVIISFIISFIVGFVLLFSFWDNVVKWVEHIFQ